MTALADIFDRHERVFLAFSGGKDSLTVAHLCESWRDRLTLLWANTGYMAPHMAEFVRGHRERFDLIELAPSGRCSRTGAISAPRQTSCRWST